MKISEEVLLENGFEKRQGQNGYFFVKGRIGVVQNVKWLACNVETGEPDGTNSYVNTIEELYKLAKEGGVCV